jgi:hypothetical protein
MGSTDLKLQQFSDSRTHCPTRDHHELWASDTLPNLRQWFAFHARVRRRVVSARRRARRSQHALD